MRLFIIFLLLFLLTGTSTVAADLFTVDDIKVHSNGANANQAKDTAVLAGQREAFAKLIERIASNTTNSTLLNIDAEKLGELVQGVEVNDEKITASYYSATLSISFNKALVEKLLKDNSINFTDRKSAPIVLVPLLVANSHNMLFEEENPLRKALAAVTSSNHVLTIVVPVNLRGVDKTRLNQNIEELPQDVRNSLLKVGQDYKADKLILIAAAQNAGDTSSLSVRMQDIKDPASSIKEISFNAKDASNGEDIFTYASRGITSILEGQWVKGKTENNASLSKITLTIPITGLGDWTSIHKKLENLGFLKDITVKSLTVKYALVDVSFGDTFANLNSRMAENSLFLENTGDTIILHVKSPDVPSLSQNPNIPDGARDDIQR